MAEVIWTRKAQVNRCNFYIRGRMEFGITVANRTDLMIEEIENSLSRWPETGYPEPLLKSSPFLYRAKHINKRYKLIYRYEESIDTVYIVDIWDTRRSPDNLTGRIK